MLSETVPLYVNFVAGWNPEVGSLAEGPNLHHYPSCTVHMFPKQLMRQCWVWHAGVSDSHGPARHLFPRDDPAFDDPNFSWLWTPQPTTSSCPKTHVNPRIHSAPRQFAPQARGLPQLNIFCRNSGPYQSPLVDPMKPRTMYSQPVGTAPHGSHRPWPILQFWDVLTNFHEPYSLDCPSNKTVIETASYQPSSCMPAGFLGPSREPPIG